MDYILRVLITLPLSLYALPDCLVDSSERWHNCTGTSILPNGEIYVGDFKNDNKTGQGTYTWPSGDVYKGDFVDGTISGKGIFEQIFFASFKELIFPSDPSIIGNPNFLAIFFA